MHFAEGNFRCSVDIFLLVAINAVQRHPMMKCMARDAERHQIEFRFDNFDRNSLRTTFAVETADGDS